MIERKDVEVSDETRELLIVTKGEEFKLTVPAKFKITFGALQPGQQGYGGERTSVLRIYESEKQQRAVFRDVISFRDLSMPLERRVDVIHAENEEDSDGDGNREGKFEIRSGKSEWESVE